MSRFKWLAGIIAVSVGVASVPAGAASFLYGLTRQDAGRNLVYFYSETPGTFISNVPITGAVDAQTRLFGLDLDTSNNTLYAVGGIGGGQYALFSVATNGVATKIGTNFGLNIGTENTGFEYNPALNKFLILTNDEHSYLVDPVTGLASDNGIYAYAAGDPLGQRNPNVIAAAIGNKTYVLDKNGPGTGTSLLSTMTGNTLNSVAQLNLVIDTNASFDIAPNGEAYFDSGVVADHLYRITNLTNGTFVDKGALALQLTGLTSAPAVPEPASWALLGGGFLLAGAALRRRTRGPAHVAV